MSKNQNRQERRDFLKASAVAGVGYWVAGGVTAQESKSPNEKVGNRLRWRRRQGP